MVAIAMPDTGMPNITSWSSEPYLMPTANVRTIETMATLRIYTDEECFLIGIRKCRCQTLCPFRILLRTLFIAGL